MQGKQGITSVQTEPSVTADRAVHNCKQPCVTVQTEKCITVQTEQCVIVQTDCCISVQAKEYITMQTDTAVSNYANRSVYCCANNLQEKQIKKV